MKTTYLRPVLDLQATGLKIKALRKLRGISIRQIQVMLDFPYPQTVYNWEAGKNMPTIDNLVILAQLFDVPMEEMLVTRMVEVDIEDCSGTLSLSA